MVICQLFVLNYFFTRALNPTTNEMYDLVEMEDVPTEEDLANYKKSLFTSLLTPTRMKKQLKQFDF